MIFDPLFLPELGRNLLFLPYFLFAIFVSFYIPGSLVLPNTVKKEYGFFAYLSLSFIIGLVFFAFQGALFGYVGLRFLTYVYLASCFLLWYKRHPVLQSKRNITRFIEKGFRDKKQWFLLIVIILVGIFGQTQAFFSAGLVLSEGIHIISGSSDDQFWHTALISQLVRRFPPQEPGLFGVPVYNYHYWSSLVPAELIRIFHLPLLPAQYLFIYPFLSFLLGGSAFALSAVLRFRKATAVLFVFMQYFSSDIFYIVTFITRSVFDLTGGPLEEGTAFLENPPRAYAIIITFAGIALLSLWFRTRQLRYAILVSLLFGSIIGFKVHTGVMVIAGLGCLGIYFLVTKQWRMVLPLLATVVISACIYFPVNKESGGLLYSAFEMARNFAVQPQFALSRLELARRVYHDYLNPLQELRMDLMMLFIFLLSQFGIRNAGWLPSRKVLRTLGLPIYIFVAGGTISAMTLATFFLQPVSQLDIFNFYVSGSLLLSIPAAIVLGQLFEKKKAFAVLMIVLLISLTIPRWIYKTRSITTYIDKAGHTPIVATHELKAMDFLRDHTKQDDLVLVINKGNWDSHHPYVSIFTNRDMFLSGQVILGRHGIPTKERSAIVEQIATSTNHKDVRRLLEENNIDILYFYGNDELSKGLAGAGMQKIYQDKFFMFYRFPATRKE
ncbi:MAG: hypothetical protein HY430_01915 [Candidatus Levybacteria bacterium]|nr:hypothetical protein [Candidatus Levybacteria bacterium]